LQEFDKKNAKFGAPSRGLVSLFFSWSKIDSPKGIKIVLVQRYKTNSDVIEKPWGGGDRKNSDGLPLSILRGDMKKKNGWIFSTSRDDTRNKERME